MSSLPSGDDLSRQTLIVVAAVIERGERVLVTRRQPGVHLEGYWEFPGGKCEPGEVHEACLARELEEELGVSALVGARILSVSHAYEDRTIELNFYACTIEGDPRPLLRQEIKWATRSELSELRFPPADEELIHVLTAGSDGTPTKGNGETTADPPGARSTRVPGSARSRPT
jgi:mutator protein MutT